MVSYLVHNHLFSYFVFHKRLRKKYLLFGKLKGVIGCDKNKVPKYSQYYNLVQLLHLLNT